MRLTTKSEYTLLSLIYLGRHKDKEYVRIEEISSHYGISEKYLRQLFNLLREHKLIHAKAGIHGGYHLAKKPSKISVASVVRLMDGPLAATGSVSKYFFSHDKFEKEKKMLLVLKDIRNYIAYKLEHLTIEDLI